MPVSVNPPPQDAYIRQGEWQASSLRANDGSGKASKPWIMWFSWLFEYVTPPRTLGYDYQQPATGFSLSVANKTEHLILDPAAGLATGTVTLPTSPKDGQAVSVSTSQSITTLTVSVTGSQAIKNAPTTLAAGGGFCHVFVSSNSTWYRKY